jgi:hypothetical protein
MFSRIVDKGLIKYNFGFQGIFGFFFLTIISIFTSFFLSHDFVHNIGLHLIGILSFMYFIEKKKKFNDLKKLLIVILILYIGSYVYKNHDDFPYYHLTYALNLSENQFIVGTGNFSHGFRTFSSLFYFHSILFMPFIDYNLFHIGTFLILVFFNLIILSKIFNEIEKNNHRFLAIFSLLAFIFVNIVFYRIGEHGTDRSAQILLLLIFLFFFELVYFEYNEKIFFQKLYILLVLVFLASSMKVLYYLYLILIPVIFFKKKIFKKFLIKKNFLIIFFVSLSLFFNLITNYLNTGCFLYPSEKTCIIKTKWSIPKKEVKQMAIHYEWWAKAGGGPGYSSEISKELYVKNFIWLNNWIERHFKPKILDPLIGILFIGIFMYFTLSFFSRNNKKIINDYKSNINLFIYILPLVFLVEWFLNHPAMRYGGYVLFAIPIFIFVASKSENLLTTKKILKNLCIFFIFLTFLIYNVRNITRINKEVKIYGYNFIESPYFYTEHVASKKIINSKDFSVYSTDRKMCWASKTPCSYRKNIKAGKFLWMNMVYVYD